MRIPIPPLTWAQGPLVGEVGFEPTFLLGSQFYFDVFHRAFQRGEPGRVPEGQARVSDKELMRLLRCSTN